MRLLKLIRRYSLVRKPTLRVVNPRIGTSVIPLDQEDDQILFHYLSNKAHALTFEGSEVQLSRLVKRMCEKQGIRVQKMKTSIGRGKERLVLLHLKFSNEGEIRRLIKLT